MPLSLSTCTCNLSWIAEISHGTASYVSYLSLSSLQVFRIFPLTCCAMIHFSVLMVATSCRRRKYRHFQGNLAHGVLATMQNGPASDWKAPVSYMMGFLPLTFPRTEAVNWKSAVQLCLFLGSFCAESWKCLQLWSGSEWTSGLPQSSAVPWGLSGLCWQLIWFCPCQSCMACFQPQTPAPFVVCTEELCLQSIQKAQGSNGTSLIPYS